MEIIDHLKIGMPEDFCLTKEDVIEIYSAFIQTFQEMSKEEREKIDGFGKKLGDIICKRMVGSTNDVAVVQRCSLDEIFAISKKFDAEKRRLFGAVKE